jgi:Rrf2 family protein
MIVTMISRTAEYALRALTALHGDSGQVVGAGVLSKTSGVPANYLSKIMHLLGRAGLVTGARGPGGGFRLSRPASEISAYEIVRVFDDLEGQRRCFLGNKVCSGATACAAHDSWSRVWDSYEKFLRGMTLESLTPPREIRGARPRRRVSRG